MKEFVACNVVRTSLKEQFLTATISSEKFLRSRSNGPTVLNGDGMLSSPMKKTPIFSSDTSRQAYREQVSFVFCLKHLVLLNVLFELHGSYFSDFTTWLVYYAFLVEFSVFILVCIYTCIEPSAFMLFILVFILLYINAAIFKVFIIV